MRFTTFAMYVDLLVASMAAKPFSSTYLQAGIGGAQNWDLSCCCCDANALLTELAQLMNHLCFVLCTVRVYS